MKLSFVIALLALAAVPVASPAAGEGPDCAVVTLKDRSQVRLDAATVVIPWTETEVRDEFTCVPTRFRVEEITEVIILNQAWNACEGRDEWLFDVYFVDREPLRGFIRIHDTRVSGRPLASGGPGRDMAQPQESPRTRTIPFREVDRVTFLRGGK